MGTSRSSQDSDPLEGFRGDDEDLAAGERLLVQRRQAAASLIELVGASQAMVQWMETPHGKMLSKQVEHDLDVAVKTWLESEDPTADAVVKAHANARVCQGIIKTIEMIIAAGPEAMKAVQDGDAIANEELSNNG
jgi:hypothetical protein